MLTRDKTQKSIVAGISKAEYPVFGLSRRFDDFFFKNKEP